MVAGRRPYSVFRTHPLCRVRVDGGPGGRWPRVAGRRQCTDVAWRVLVARRQGPNLSLLAPDGSSERPLFSTSGATEFARPIFSRDGREVLMLRRDMSAPGRGAWKLFATAVASGVER